MIISIDHSELTTTLRRYVSRANEAWRDVVNWAALNVVCMAILLTKRTHESEIVRQFGTIPGSLVPSATRPKISRVENIIRAAVNRRGGQQPTKNEMATMMLDFLIRRYRSLGYLRSGWLPAMRQLEPYSPRRVSITPNARQFGPDRGGARPATSSGWRTTAEFWNSTGVSSRAYGNAMSQQDALLRFGGPALDIAMTMVQRHLEQAMTYAAAQAATRAGIVTSNVTSRNFPVITPAFTP